MGKEFNSIASNIIKESITNALFVDDKALEPFEVNKEGFEDFTKVYNSFKKHNCFLDIRRYKNIGHKIKFNRSLSKTDLLVLDWQLDESDINFLISLKMLSTAISTKNVHFVCIYTKRENEEIEDQILYPITSYFNSKHNGKAIDRLEPFYELLDNQGIEKREFIEKFSGLIKEVTFFYHQQEEISTMISEINSLLKEIGLYDEFIQYIDNTYSNCDSLEKKIIQFGYDVNESPISNNLYEIRISKNDRNTIYVNDTVIKIRNKMDTKDLYQDFCESLINDHNIFFTLFGLEMRNRFRESAAFIGTEISSIDEIALFYHQNQIEDSEFAELLKNIWKEQSSSFLYEKKIEILDALETYKTDRKIKHKINTYSKKKIDNRLNLAKINTFYNTLDIKRMKGDTIKFGDIFNQKGEKFFLCITPHCDCLRPADNIENMFHFVEGEAIKLSEGLGSAERDFLSFVYYNNMPICIKWRCRPFSIHISDEKNNISGMLRVANKGVDINISYLCTLRENYCQRIANNSFGFPLRVGITFAS
jgi:hypothetical protein